MIGYDSGYARAIVRVCKINKTGGGGKKLSKVLAVLMRLIWPCDIDPNATLGKIQIHHAVGIVIGSAAVIEDNVKIMSGVVIGSRNPGDQQHAHVEHDVMIGANAVILGKITIGHNAQIGANAVITKDVPANATVVGNNIIISKTES